MVNASSEFTEKPGFRDAYRQKFNDTRDAVWRKKATRVKYHKSFKRSYREDYDRPLESPGMLSFAMTTLKFMFKNWRLFVPLIFIIAFLNIFLVGIMSESTYVTFQDTLDDTADSLASGELGTAARAGLLLISSITTGGLNQGMTEVQQVFAILLFIITWLTTIHLARHLMAGNRPKLRDGLYGSLAPLLSSLLVFAVVFLHLIPIFIVIITYSAAVSTNFLSTPFYAFIYWLFAAALILLSAYLVPGSLLALVAVSAPGMYPMTALNAASDLVASRRTRFVFRVVFGLIFLIFIWVIIMLPITILDLLIKSNLEWTEGIPIVPFCLLIMTCFTFVYASLYVYLFYRKMLDDPN